MILMQMGNNDTSYRMPDIFNLCNQVERSVFNLLQDIGLAIWTMDIYIPVLLINIGFISVDYEIFPILQQNLK